MDSRVALPSGRRTLDLLQVVLALVVVQASVLAAPTEMLGGVALKVTAGRGAGWAVTVWPIPKCLCPAGALPVLDPVREKHWGGNCIRPTSSAGKSGAEIGSAFSQKLTVYLERHL
ncbi:MAG: hypothetical protein WAU91_09345 [Desulfatitalea sp.]